MTCIGRTWLVIRILEEVQDGLGFCQNWGWREEAEWSSVSHRWVGRCGQMRESVQKGRCHRGSWPSHACGGTYRFLGVNTFWYQLPVVLTLVGSGN